MLVSLRVLSNRAFSQQLAVPFQTSALMNRLSCTVKGTEGTEHIVQLEDWAGGRGIIETTIRCRASTPAAVVKAGQVHALVHGLIKQKLRLLVRTYRRARSALHAELTILLAQEDAEERFEELSGR